jgi:hypothetical protein
MVHGERVAGEGEEYKISFFLHFVSLANTRWKGERKGRRV